MAADPIETVKSLDMFWSEGRFGELADVLAPDVVVVGSHGRRFVGRDAVLAGYRDFRATAEVKVFKSENYVATTQGDAAVVEYEWTMQWTSGGQATMHAAARSSYWSGAAETGRSSGARRSSCRVELRLVLVLARSFFLSLVANLPSAMSAIRRLRTLANPKPRDAVSIQHRNTHCDCRHVGSLAGLP